MSESDLTAARLRELLHYNPDTGAFTRRVATGWRGNRPAGSAVAGWRTEKGYLATTVNGQQYRIHRLAVLWMTGEWPAQEVDHINGVRDDNRWCNLRCVSRRVNAENRRGPQSTNTTGFLGVYRHGKSGFGSRIKVDGVGIHLGTFPTPEEAYAAVLAAKRKHHDGNTL